MSDATEQQEATAETGGESLTPSPRARRRRLANVRNVRLALADLLSKLELDLVEPGRARVMIYGYSVLIDAIRGSDVEARLAALERKTP